MSTITWENILEQRNLLCSTVEKIDKTSRIALFGFTGFGQWDCDYLTAEGYKVICYIDNSPQLQGTFQNGLPVVGPSDELVETVDVVLTTMKTPAPEILQSFEGRLACLPFDTWFASRSLDKYETIRNQVLCDNEGRQCLDAILLSMLTWNRKYCCSVCQPNQYFCLPHFTSPGKEYFIDLGAYVGDTVEQFIWANGGGFKHLHAFEPGVATFQALQKRTTRLVEEWALDTDTISLVQAGIAETSSRANMTSSESGLSSTGIEIDDAEGDTQLLTLDEYLKTPVTLIKADIEGMELQMLRGAQETLQKYRPKLALCVYHRPDDLFTLTDYLHSLVPEYQMTLRHHAPNLAETVLYCWIDD